MVDRKARASLLAQFLFVLLILIPICCIVLPVVRDARGPRGDPIPLQQPDERNRVHHPMGFSLVVPSNWDHHISFNSGPLVLAPRDSGSVARRSKALIVVTHLGHHRPEDLEHLRPTSFQGQEAYEGMRVVRPWTFDDGAWSEYMLFLAHDGDWYEVRYGIAEERTVLPSKVSQYLNTLRWDEAK